MVISGVLSSAYFDSSDTFQSDALHTLAHDMPVSYDMLNNTVVCGNPAELLAISPDSSVRALGLENPGAPVLSSSGSGGLEAGRYGVAITYLRGNEESAMSSISYIDVPQNQGITITLPQPAESLPTSIRIYRTVANGGTPFRADDAPVGVTTWVTGVRVLGRAADTQFLARMTPGHIVRYWRGRLLVASGKVLKFSEPMRYGLFDPRTGFVQFARKILMVRPVESGVYVGTADGVVFLRGDKPGDFVVADTGGKPPIEGCDAMVDAAEFGDVGVKGKRVALWLAGNGFVVGSTDGSINELQASRVRLPNGSGGIGALVVNRRQAVAVVN